MRIKVRSEAAMHVMLAARAAVTANATGHYATQHNMLLE